ncbi:FHA domain-containing protein [Kineosporia babensis]|uniref:FHA domain-containing protein n=1 Tax=Kineosporia babensis TaxID=499548 RepID=A0A9X1T177_9ACTN|nr:FHA domain-containing protein [Kineosporia babensis]MCD5313543.1 FHA domain-containing protein [Kineosporia babensis]
MSSRCPDGHASESTDYCDVCGVPMNAAPAAPPAPTPAANPLDLGPAPTSGGAGGSGGAADKECPNCQAVVPVDDLFCEVCGYDFTTGVMPEPVTDPNAETEAPAPDAVVVNAAAAEPTNPRPVTPPASGSPAAADPSAAVNPPAAGDPTTPVEPAAAEPSKLTWVAEVWIDPDWYSTQESDEPCPSAGMPAVIPLWDKSILVGRKSTSRNIHPQVDCGTDHGVSRRHAQLTTDGQRWFAEDLQSSNGTYIAPAGAPLPVDPIEAGQRIEFREGDRVYVGAWTRIVIRRATPDEQ